MISGVDITFPVTSGTTVMENIAHTIYTCWPHGLVEVTGSCARPFTERISYSICEEMFVYRNKTAVDQVEQDVGDYSGMIHVLYDKHKGQITIVIDEFTPEMEQIVQTIYATLRIPDEILYRYVLTLFVKKYLLAAESAVGSIEDYRIELFNKMTAVDKQLVELYDWSQVVMTYNGLFVLSGGKLTPKTIRAYLRDYYLNYSVSFNYCRENSKTGNDRNHKLISTLYDKLAPMEKDIINHISFPMNEKSDLEYPIIKY